MTAAVASVVSVLVLRLWRQPLSVPFDYGGDSSYYLMFAQGLERHGSFLTNPDLGFPSGQVLYDIPEGLDLLHIVVLRFLTTVLPAIAAVNVFQLLTFPTIAATTHVVLRRFGVSRVFASVLSLLFAFLPYHLQRRNAHLFLSSYALIPVLVLLAVALLSADPPGLDPRRRRNWWAIAACVGLAMSGPYYASFAVILWSISAAFGALIHRSLARLWTGATMVGIIGVVAVLELLPNLRYWGSNGRNAAVISRSPHETEIYGIRLQQLFMPRWDHRVPVLSTLGSRSLQGPYLAEGVQSLGVVGGASFFAMLVFTLVAVLRGGPDRNGTDRVGPDRSTSGPVRPLVFVSVVAVLVGVVSGFGFFVSWAGLREIRAYNRLSVVVAFCAFAVLGVVATRWFAGRSRRMELGVAAALLLFGLFDQTSPRDAIGRSEVESTWRDDAAFYGAMADALPPGSGVLQLPHLGYPESPGVGKIGTYDPGRGYLHAPELRWSFGAVDGRSSPPPPDLPARPGAEIVEYARTIGARAIVIDAYGFDDLATDLNRRLAEAGERPVGISVTGRYAWFDLGDAG